ncbi:hypothetical protein AURDEDRAFT_188139 [Auricularia subglabra TFB-10046 SS5]|uniref:Uncharacterized protein n=1 Tax=Auricularia subglabra (strain TFB-10046 / SS5) TaxID=717982 RepID=J0DAH5_AURST|nr:hypothetical protein AURDEDRAFT_188139 [Auricularia subglabra TFB-10046 SS5]
MRGSHSRSAPSLMRPSRLLYLSRRRACFGAPPLVATNAPSCICTSSQATFYSPSTTAGSYRRPCSPTSARRSIRSCPATLAALTSCAPSMGSGRETCHPAHGTARTATGPAHVSEDGTGISLWDRRLSTEWRSLDSFTSIRVTRAPHTRRHVRTLIGQPILPRSPRSAAERVATHNVSAV